MATFTASPGNNNIANAETAALSGFTGGTLAELQDGEGDIFIGSAGADIIVAASGGDTLTGGAGADYMIGGEGADLFIYNTGDAVAGEVANGLTGLDTILATGTLDFTECDIDHFGTLQTSDDGADISILNTQTGGSGFTRYLGGSGNDILTIYMSPNQTFENMTTDNVVLFEVTGFELIRIIDDVGAANSIVGSIGVDNVSGGKGDDTISTREGNDTISGGTGSDSINCGDGNADQVVFTGPLSRYSVYGQGVSFVVVDNLGIYGADTIRNSEFLDFDGQTYATSSLANNVATIAGTDTGIVKEDSIDTATGELTVSDSDSGQESFQTTPVIAAKYGVFTIDASGHWTYELNNALAAVQRLGNGQTILDTIRVVSFDNTAHDITITIHGQSELINDPAGNSAGSVRGTAGGDIINGFGGNDTLQGLGGNDLLSGGSGNDTLSGGRGNDTLNGSYGKDVLWGNAGNDILVGKGGRDSLDGGAGNDVFDYNAVSDSSAITSDTIVGFGNGADLIDVLTIDAKAGENGNNGFTFIGTNEFTAEGQIRIIESGADVLILLNTSGSADAEMKIVLSGVPIASVSESDFIL